MLPLLLFVYFLLLLYLVYRKARSLFLVRSIKNIFLSHIFFKTRIWNNGVNFNLNKSDFYKKLRRVNVNRKVLNIWLLADQFFSYIIGNHLKYTYIVSSLGLHTSILIRLVWFKRTQFQRIGQTLLTWTWCMFIPGHMFNHLKSFLRGLYLLKCWRGLFIKNLFKVSRKLSFFNSGNCLSIFHRSF